MEMEKGMGYEGVHKYEQLAVKSEGRKRIDVSVTRRG